MDVNYLHRDLVLTIQMEQVHSCLKTPSCDHIYMNYSEDYCSIHRRKYSIFLVNAVLFRHLALLSTPDRIRTCNLLLRRQLLYPLSYRGVFVCITKVCQKKLQQKGYAPRFNTRLRLSLTWFGTNGLGM